MRKAQLKTITLLATCTAFLIGAVNIGTAQEANKETIVDALRLKSAPEGARTFRGVGKEGEDPLTPKIDLKVQFEYNSADLTEEAKITLNALGEALNDEKLAELKFRVIGHTDARGADEFNQKLSEARASEVVAYLGASHNIPTERLNSSGEGEQRLADGDNPESAENRRVEIQTIVE